MSNELDTSWFNLENYAELEKLDLKGWYRQLFMRWYFKKLIIPEYKCEFVATILPVIKKLPIWLDGIKTTPIIKKGIFRWHLWEDELIYPFDTHSVTSTDTRTFFEFHELYDFKTTSEHHEIINKPLNLTLKDKDLYHSSMHYVTVDLSATDEQIMKDFKHWLTEYRKFTDIESNKNKFSDKHLSKWIAHRILPYIDLMLIAEFEGKNITKTNIANIIFSDEFEKDIEGKLKKVTIPTAHWLLRESTLASIEKQIHKP
ncbi:MAG: DUF6387 family protein [Methylococcales bacterium]